MSQLVLAERRSDEQVLVNLVPPKMKVILPFCPCLNIFKLYAGKIGKILIIMQ